VLELVRLLDRKVGRPDALEDIAGSRRAGTQRRTDRGAVARPAASDGPQDTDGLPEIIEHAVAIMAVGRQRGKRRHIA